MLIAFRRTSRSALLYTTVKLRMNQEAKLVIPREDLQNIHDERVKNVAMLRAEGIEAVEDDELRVVVRLLLDEADVARRGS